ncbi:MAG: methyltransferase [Cyclobacteriaceae bacterium]
MGLKPFQFKKFSIAQDVCTHKVGTDGVLLGAWVNVSETDTAILDIGTGSGLIAIMLAQRTSIRARIDALDIEVQDVQQAKENVQRSPWPKKISVLYTALQQFHPNEQYDLIVTNPPYFVDSLLPPDEKRKRARHAQELSSEDLLKNAVRLLSKRGRLAVILPYAEGLHFVKLALKYHLFPQRQSAFRSRSHKPAERLLIELSAKGKHQEDEEIILYGNGDEWSEQYRRLTCEFYLKA